MVPNVTDMIALVKDLEAELHLKGWDSLPPTLCMITASDDRRELLVAELPVQTTDVHENYFVGLHMLATVWESGDMDEHLKNIPASAQEAMVGVMLCAETWTTEQTPQERGFAPASEAPDAQDARLVLAVDVGGRFYFCQRTRGEFPELDLIASPDEGRTVAGPAAQSLAVMLFHMTKFAPAGSVDTEKLKPWTAPVMW